ncbi:MAG: SH3 domain-containing protein [Firmicutes bacterium]|nr:SH3 domain-containing protein [Bacillota bacterium]
MIDTDGWAFVKSDKPTDRLHLRTAPSTDAVSIGRYYSGTPVQVLEDQGEWAKVSIAGIQGYMMKKFLAFGQDMLNVERWFPGKHLTEKAAEKGINVYASPDTASAIIGILRGGDGLAEYILATVGDGWYHVLRGDGLSGYVEAGHFWDGNG